MHRFMHKCAGALLGCALLLSGPSMAEESDPFEGINRGVYKFNKVVDTYLVRPIAIGYDAVLPDVAKQGVDNFFHNLAEINTIVNDILQGKFQQAGQDTGRFLLNSTLGIGGLVDVSTDLGLARNDEDFGQTIAYWGVEDSPYLVLPLIGPSSLVDAPGRFLDGLTNPIRYVDDVSVRNSFTAGLLVSKRAGLLDLDRTIAEAVDEYAFVRSSYLQRRRGLVYDGSPPDEFELEDE